MPNDIAIGFDLDHTLVIDNTLERTTALALLAEIAAAREIAYDTAAAGTAIDVALVAYRAGDQSLEAAIAGFLQKFVPGGETSDVIDEAQEFRDRVIAAAPSHVEALPGVAELFDRLDALGVPYAILSNGWSPLQEEKARAIAFRGSVFVSERIGARKPTRDAFDILVSHFDLPRERVWYVGDDPKNDCAGAQESGLASVWFDWENVAYPSDLPPPDHVIHTLAELAALVQGRRPDAAKTV